MSIAPTELHLVDDNPADTVPSHYVCSTCGATGVKLWRETAVSAVDLKLVCATCMCAELHKDITAMDPRKGTIDEGVYGPDNCFGIYLPAVPSDGRRDYWMHAHVPPDAAEWWFNLPLTA